MEEYIEDVSYARKFRPVDFDGYIGNSDIKDTIMRYLKKGRPQTMLIQGDSGCGKTTLARIIAREYRCENRDPEKGACGVCQSCQMFNEYIKYGKTDMLSDIYEVDASDSSGKKDIDGMLSTMEFPALYGDWKVYIIDEAHLLTKDGMGRLLKSLEEPPEGVLILICTTDPDKLLVTVRNRSQVKFAVTKPSTVEIMTLLRRICAENGKEYDLEGLRMLVARADNVVRDSLNNLETVLMTRDSATAVSVSEQFHQVNDKIVFDFFRAYRDDEFLDYIDIMYKIKTQFNFNQFLNALTTFVVRGIYIINGVNVEGLSKEELLTYKELFQQFSPEELAVVLRDLRRMPLGSVEANLMSFIYCKGSGEENRVIEKPTINESSVTQTDETKYRNNNLQRLEQDKIAKSRVSLENEMKTVSFADMGNMFSLEKVDI